MKYTEAIQDVKFKRNKRYALVGNEPYLKDQFINACKHFNSGMEVMEFWPGHEDDALTLMEPGGLFSERFVIFHNIEGKKVVNKILKSLVECENYVVFVFSEDVDTRSREMTDLLSKCTRVECNKMKVYGDDYTSWISSKIKDAGYDFEDGVPEAIYMKVGNGMFTLINEIKKVFIIREKGSIITIKDINLIMSNTAIKSSYDILEALLKKDLLKAFMSFNSYSKIKDNYIELITFLFIYMEKMYRILLLRDRKHTIESIADIVGIPKYLISTKYLPSANTLGKTFFIDRINSLCELDMKIRIFSGPKRVIFENFFMSFSNNKV